MVALHRRMDVCAQKNEMPHLTWCNSSWRLMSTAVRRTTGPQWKTSAWNTVSQRKTILQMTAAPLPLVPNIRRHLRSMNNTEKKAGANQICRATTSDATPHAVQLSLRPVLRIFSSKKSERQTKTKTWKSAFPHGRAKVALCGWPDDQHEPPIHGRIRAALRSTQHCESKHKQTRCLKWCEQCADCCVSLCAENNKHATQALVVHVFDAHNVLVATTPRPNDARLVERSHHTMRRFASRRAIPWTLIPTDVLRTSTKHPS